MNRSQTMHRRRGQGGFTLLEVAIALSILTIVGAALATATATSFKTIAGSETDPARAAIGLQAIEQASTTQYTILMSLDSTQATVNGWTVLYFVTDSPSTQTRQIEVIVRDPSLKLTDMILVKVMAQH